jgi:uncharacterized protein (TIGR03067 family)
VSGEDDGKKITADDASMVRLRLVVTREKMRFVVMDGGQEKFDEFTYTLDTNARPKRLDGEGGILMIYMFQGENLVLCGVTGSKFRPKEFTGKAGSGCNLMVWRRLK